MTTTQIAMISIIVIALIALAVVLYLYNRTKKLRAQFGPEYNRAVEEAGSRSRPRHKAEETQGRRDTRPKRHLRSLNLRHYPLRPLSSADRDRFQQSWRTIQATFVDDPSRAISDADQLLGTVMSARGYTVSDFEQRAAEI